MSAVWFYAITVVVYYLLLLLTIMSIDLQFATLLLESAPHFASMGSSNSLGIHSWYILAPQRVILPQKSTPKSHSLSPTVTVSSIATNKTCSERYPIPRGCLGFTAFTRKVNKTIRGCATSPFVVANDEKYGNKQIISITPRLYDYILANVREPEV